LDHAEAHAAAMVRESGARRVDLVINNPPCDPCRTLLAAILPPGVVLNLYVRKADGDVEPYDTYSGTGEAVEPCA